MKTLFMDLNYTEQQVAFRAEVRQWLVNNVPVEPLPSFDTAKGFQAHREWKRSCMKGIGA